MQFTIAEVAPAVQSRQATASHPANDVSQMLHDYLQGRDVPCPHCGYNLRNTSSLRCPECGTMIEFSIGIRRVKQGAWLWCVIASALPLGFCLIMSCAQLYAVRSVVLQSPEEKQILWTLGIGSGVALVMLMTMILARPLMLRGYVFVRWIFAAIWTGGIGMGTVYFLLALSQAIGPFGW